MALIQAFLIRHLKPESTDPLIEYATQQLYQSPSCAITTLAQALGLGKRQLERRWKTFAGHSPSGTRGLIRFQKTLRSLLLNPSHSILDTALAWGYYDQAHFIHDVRSRVGLAPQQLLTLARSRTHFYNPPRSTSPMIMAPH